MQWKQPKNTSKYHWTAHVAEKMHYYGLSEQKVLGVIRNPKRIETGIAQDTVAVMAPVGNIKKGIAKPKWGRASFGNVAINVEDENSSFTKASADAWNQEIWVMYQVKSESQKSKPEKEKQNDRKSESINPNIQKLKKLMQLKTRKLIIISAWRYPGISPKNNPVPEEILRELEDMI